MMSPEEIMNRSAMEAASKNKKKRTYMIGGVSALVVIAIIVSVVVVTTGGVDPEKAAMKKELTKALSPFNVNTDDMFDEDSHQGKAFAWLFDNKDQAYHRSQLLQRFALACLYFSTYRIETLYSPNPPAWINATNWLTSENECTWNGVQCNDRDKVEGFSLEQNQLTGKIPMETVLLKDHLKTINMTSNLIYMEADDMQFFEHLTQVETILLDDNYIHSEEGVPTYLGACTDLKKLRMSYNLLEGQLDNTLFHQLSQLTHLEIESNFLTGSIPQSIGKLENLVYLYMRRNSLSFNLNFLKTGKLNNLFALWLDANDVKGTLPTELGAFSDLASLSITNSSNLTGTIPSELSELTDLRRLWLYNNALTGTIPQLLNRLTGLEVFEIHHNQISGPMPSTICSTVFYQQYIHKALSADCGVGGNVTCNTKDCCTKCYSPGDQITDSFQAP